MEIIKMESYERNDLYRILDYAKAKKLDDLNNKKITKEMYEMDIEKIKTIVARINGKYKRDYIVQSTFNL